MSADKLAGRLMLVGAVVFAIAAATILTAHAFESLGGYLPCHLCLEERYAYYFAVPAAAVAFFAARRESNGAARVVLLLVALAFVANAALGVYHSGVEWKWWAGPTECSGGSTIEWGEGGLAAQLNNAKIIACDQAAWRLLGLSFAGWNAVVSGLLALIAAWGAAQKR
ncbi:MAG: disulfide bond formation protein B [Methyloceanibacter sp.]